MNTKKVYEQREVARGFGKNAMVTGSIGYRKKLREKVFQKLKSRIGTLLDAGCGNGLLLKKLARTNLTLTGLDFSHGMITEAKKRAYGEFIIGDVTGLPFENQSFNYTVCIDVLHHLPNYQSLFKAIDELLRVTDKVLIIELKTNDSLRWIRRLAMQIIQTFQLKKKTRETPLHGMTYHSVNLPKIIQFLKKRKVKGIQVERISLAVDWKLLTIRL